MDLARAHVIEPGNRYACALPRRFRFNVSLFLPLSLSVSLFPRRRLSVVDGCALCFSLISLSSLCCGHLYVDDLFGMHSSHCTLPLLLSFLPVLGWTVLVASRDWVGKAKKRTRWKSCSRICAKCRPFACALIHWRLVFVGVQPWQSRYLRNSRFSSFSFVRLIFKPCNAYI